MNFDMDEQADRQGGRLRAFWLVLGLVIVGGLVPPAFYWALFGRVATVTIEEAKQRLKRNGEETVLVDVRRPEVFAAGHLGGAVNWPIDAVLALRQADELPPAFRGKTLLLVCGVGWDSRRAADHLAAIGVGRAINVRGGIQEWIHATPSPTLNNFDRWQIGPDRLVAFPFRESPLGEQVAAVAAFFFFKPIYTILSLLIVIALWNSREADLAAVRWAMIAFFVGENACAVNYFAFKETSNLFEYLHSFGMAVCFGFLAYAVLEGFDRRILMLSDPRRPCAVAGDFAGPA